VSFSLVGRERHSLRSRRTLACTPGRVRQGRP